MSSTLKEFEKYCKGVKTLTYLPSNNDLLILYGLYKQSTIGDCNTKKPSIFDIKGSSKWNSWNSFKGVSKQGAMQIYIQKAQMLLTQ
jgi:diazepam-binding inhibitor (GABA receptor modulating acyl-CoA-binding protein)